VAKIADSRSLTIGRCYYTPVINFSMNTLIIFFLVKKTLQVVRGTIWSVVKCFIN